MLGDVLNQLLDGLDVLQEQLELALLELADDPLLAPILVLLDVYVPAAAHDLQAQLQRAVLRKYVVLQLLHKLLRAAHFPSVSVQAAHLHKDAVQS